MTTPSDNWRMLPPGQKLPSRSPDRIANPEALPGMRVRQRDVMPPPDVVLDNVLALHARGQLDAAVSSNPELKRVTDALEAQGDLQRVGGKLVPRIDRGGRRLPDDSASPRAA